MGTEDVWSELNEISQQVIGCAIKVSSTLGVGFIEKVYENALALELQRAGLRVQEQVDLTVRYEGVAVGHYTADILVEGRILLEIKVARAIEDAHQAQLLNYLTATNLRLGLILNFGTSRLGIKRMVN